MSGPSILVLSASTGNGHVSAGKAIVAEALERGLRAEHVDVMDWVTPGFRRWYRGGYETLVRRNPKTWGHLYRTSDRKRFNYYFQTALDTAFCKRLGRLLDEWRPDWVVCTHSLPQPALDRFRGLGFRVAVTVTDLYVHRMWLRGRVDTYFVPQEWSREVLERRLPDFRGDVVVSGMPVNAVFRSVGRGGGVRLSVAAELGFGEVSEEETWILVSSGGIGGGPLLSAVEVLGRLPVRTVVVAGRNARMKADLEALSAGFDRVHVLGAVEQGTMAALMGASDLLVSKPGGLTTFEALTVGLPFVVYWPFLIPGQEEGNAAFLEECGAGVIVRSKEDLGRTVERLLADRPTLERMRAAALGQAKPEATRVIVDHLCGAGVLR